MKPIYFDFRNKEITVQHVLNISPQRTNYRIIDNELNLLWLGTELNHCKYRNYEVVYMRVVGEPYRDGYIELRIDVKTVSDEE